MDTPPDGAGHEPELPPAARCVIAAVRDGTAGAMFPPVITDGPDGTVTTDRHLAGERDARMLAQALTDPRFTPFLALLDRLDTWCADAARRYSDVISEGVLKITDGDIFGPVACEAFVACATGGPHYTRERVAEWAARCEAFLTLFLDRLQRDVKSNWPRNPAFRGPVVGLWTHGEETHNGRQRVLRLDCAGGGRIAYKPRPADGELLFTAQPETGPPTSVFGLLNQAPPASGEIRLPTLACWPGSAPGYLWQEWIEPPAQWAPIRADGPWRLTGTRLTPAEAARFWHRAGSLTAAAFAFGITDLIGGNVVTGTRPGDPEPLLHPIDLEIYLCQVNRLHDTGLLYDPGADTPQHHVGLETTARWCSAEGPPVCWRAEPGGALALHRRHAAHARTETRTVVADTEGRAGYGPYLPAMLRGMFDAWTLMCRRRPEIRDFLTAHAPGRHVRVLRRPTFQYYDALVPRWLSGGGAAPHPATPDVRFDRAELAQLRRMDVPYFVRSLGGGPVLAVAPPPQPFTTIPVAARPAPEAGWPPLPGLLDGANLTLAGLGVALRDAAEHVFDDVPDLDVTDEAHGVRLRLHSPGEGHVSFDWPQTGRRVTYLWNRHTIRLRIDTADAPEVPPDPAPAGEIRSRLLRLDRLDGALRVPWADGGMTDTALEDRLRTLTDAGLDWLASVVAAHGWPGRALVGAAASGAASRLVQHAEGHRDLRHHCLDLMRQAAEKGDVPLRDVAYLTDALRIDDGRPQVYGTKFEPVAGRLEPCPVEDPDHVDHRRAAMGLDTLADHTARIRQRFPHPGRKTP
ncbi:DUF4135 domain-containing protein [Streptomyces roseirectus]|uniref:DUF4135 domain-containing protein n=1 Tax=Streptomyces roseirectus TaxID=2768066 RepID=A0A7H0ITU3_9ACTN|nr:DUF4135 domain-containing protein [Streptomyces roseirectus]QNP76209.1 DUF4135 domain-containing protein [Streptomyces roseirectus]